MKGSSKLWLQVAALAPLVVVVVWVVARMLGPAPRVAAPVTVARQSPLPSAAAVKATRREPVETFSDDGVFAYLDGGAEVYLKRGLQRVMVASYFFRGKDAGGVEIEAAVMEFDQKRGAEQQEVDLRPDEGRNVEGVQGAVTTDQELVVRRGGRVLRLVAFTLGVDASEEMGRIAAAWVASLPGRDDG